MPVLITQLAFLAACTGVHTKKMSQGRTNMNFDLTSVKVAILVANGFEPDQVSRAREFLRRAGATPMIMSPEKEKVTSVGSGEESNTLPVDAILEAADETGFDAMLLPGGQKNVESLAANPKAMAFVESFAVAKKPLGAISDGVKLLIYANVVAGRRVAAAASMRELSKPAGAEISEKPVVVDGSLVTTLGTEWVASFNEAFAQICSQHKKNTGGSLHTD
jgi:protease I